MGLEFSAVHHDGVRIAPARRQLVHSPRPDVPTQTPPQSTNTAQTNTNLRRNGRFLVFLAPRLPRAIVRRHETRLKFRYSQILASLRQTNPFTKTRCLNPHSTKIDRSRTKHKIMSKGTVSAVKCVPFVWCRSKHYTMSGGFPPAVRWLAKSPRPDAHTKTSSQRPKTAQQCTIMSEAQFRIV